MSLLVHICPQRIHDHAIRSYRSWIQVPAVINNFFVYYKLQPMDTNVWILKQENRIFKLFSSQLEQQYEIYSVYIKQITKEIRYLILKVNQKCTNCFPVRLWYTIPQIMLPFNDFIPVKFSTQHNIIQHIHDPSK